MGLIWSKATRGARKINVYHRAHKVVSKEKPDIAPRHPKSKERLDQLISTEIAEEFNEQQKKNEKLLEKLKDVKIESYGPPPEIKSSRKLPETRTALQDNEYGVQEPDSIPVGKATLRTLHHMLIEYQTSPEESTISKLSKEHKIDENALRQVLTNFKSMNLHMPEEYLKKDQSVLEAFKAKNILPLGNKDADSEKLKLSQSLNPEGIPNSKDTEQAK